MEKALSNQDSEYWRAAILDEIVNHEEIFQAFGPSVPQEQHMNVTPTGQVLIFSEVSKSSRKKTGHKIQCLQVCSRVGDYERFRARFLYVNNPRKGIQLSWDELFAPVVDKTSV